VGLNYERVLYKQGIILSYPSDIRKNVVGGLHYA